MGWAQAERARAALMPGVEATATARYSRSTQSIGLPTDGDCHWLMAGLVNLNYDLDLWGQNRASLRAAASERAASGADAATARITPAAAVSTTAVDFAQLLERRRVSAAAGLLRRHTPRLVLRTFHPRTSPPTP